MTIKTNSKNINLYTLKTFIKYAEGEKNYLDTIIS